VGKLAKETMPTQHHLPAYIQTYKQKESLVVSTYRKWHFFFASQGLLRKELGDSNSESFFFKTLSDVVQKGEHLEHFHPCLYHQLEEEEAEAAIGADDTTTTIEWHTDQGLFLVFHARSRCKW
jgi:hypothetical protein